MRRQLHGDGAHGEWTSWHGLLTQQSMQLVGALLTKQDITGQNGTSQL